VDQLDRYAKRAEDYSAFRPAYSPNAFATMSALVGLEPDWVLADIGSGTGNALKYLLDRVRTVYAVEPSTQMRAAAERRFGTHQAFRSVDAFAEDTHLPEQSVDLIVVGQALHWFDAPRARREFDRILRARGWLATVWNQFDGTAPPDLGGWFAPADQVHRRFAMSINETWDQYIGGARSAAGSPLPGDPSYQQFEETHRTRFHAQAIAGLLEVRYTTELIVGRLARPVS